MDFTKYHLTYNAAAHFAAKEKYPGGLMQAMVEEGEQGLDALCWALEELSTQGELIRRNLGYDPKEPLQAKILKAILRPADLLSAKTQVLGAIHKGLSPSQEDEEEIDEVLAELQKKTEKS